MLHTILPKERALLDDPTLRKLPLFFLAGPIQGAGNWHLRMAGMLEDAIGECIIVDPSRYPEDHPHRAMQLRGEVVDERQTLWERHYLEEAALEWPRGCVIFWLANQVSERTDGSAYGSDTIGELGEWRGRLMYRPRARVVFGAEAELFPRFSVIECNQIAAINRPFRKSMEKTVEEAVYIATHYGTGGM